MNGETRFARLGWLGALAIAATLCASCGKSKQQEVKDAIAASDNGRSHGFSTDDQAKCQWEGRADREVSEATAAGAFQPNIRRVYQIVGEGADRRKVLVCREVDTNLDGVKDVMRTFNEKGETMREEADTDYDGRVDSWAAFANGRVAKQELDTNRDGKADTWKFYLNGKLSRIQRDSNHDGKPDIWEIYVRGTLERAGVDIDFDGRVDRWDRDEVARLANQTKKTEDNGDASKDATKEGADAPKKENEGEGKDAEKDGEDKSNE